VAGAAERLGLGLGEPLERAEERDPLPAEPGPELDPLDSARFARRWTVSRMICVRTSGADRAAAGEEEGVLLGASPEASATVARAPRATTVTPAAILWRDGFMAGRIDAGPPSARQRRVKPGQSRARLF
jgi:hypothetical protein